MITAEQLWTPFGEKLRKQRELEDLTYSDIRYGVGHGFDEDYIKKVESGKIRIPNLLFIQRVCAIFGWKIEELVFIEYQRL